MRGLYAVSIQETLFKRTYSIRRDYLGDEAGEFYAEGEGLTIKLPKNPYLDEVTFELRSIGLFGMEHQLTLTGKDDHCG